MATKNEKTKFESPVVKPETPEAEAFLSAGYGGITVDQAKEIIATREKNAGLVSYEEYKQAKAFLAAYNARNLKPSATRPGWKRNRGSKYNQ